MKRKLLLLAVVTLLLLNFAPIANAQQAVTITIRCKANIVGGEGWRCDNFDKVKDDVAKKLGIQLTLNLIQDDKAWEDYKTEFTLASEAKTAPDIILSGHEDIGAWAPAGYIIPLDSEIPNYPEFADVVSNLWNSQKYDGKIWGIPQDAEARPIFFSKLLLADLGWKQEEIDSLPQRVRDGKFTFDDLVKTAQKAVADGVVEQGRGLYVRWNNGPDWLAYYYGMGGEVLTSDGKIVFDKDAALKTYQLIASFTKLGITRPDNIGIDSKVLYADFAPGKDVLFYQGGTWQWADWAKNYVKDLGGNDYLLKNIGLMLFPAMAAGKPLTLTHPLSYMVSSSSKNPKVALALLAAVTTPDANNRHAIDSFHLGILKTQVDSAEYKANKVLSSAHYMLDYTTAIPNSPAWAAWFNAYWLGVQAAFKGDATPDTAVELAVAQLKNDLGDKITIR
jgi:inositol-phosphate transport system substrate-binding protein